MDEGIFCKLTVLFFPQDDILLVVIFTCLWYHITTQNTTCSTPKLKFYTDFFQTNELHNHDFMNQPWSLHVMKGKMQGYAFKIIIIIIIIALPVKLSNSSENPFPISLCSPNLYFKEKLIIFLESRIYAAL